MGTNAEGGLNQHLIQYLGHRLASIAVEGCIIDDRKRVARIDAALFGGRRILSVGADPYAQDEENRNEKAAIHGQNMSDRP